MPVTGNATTSDGSAADLVRIFHWPSGELSAAVTPDLNGDWAYEAIVSGSYGITYIADGCQPVTHGPYYFEVTEWNPAALSTALWLDAGTPQSVILNSEDQVLEWRDLSGNDRHWAAPNAGSRPGIESSTLGKNTIVFDGAGSLLTGPEIQIKTLAVVGWWTDTTGDYRNFFAPKFDYHGDVSGGDLISNQYAQGVFRSGAGFKDGEPLNHIDFLRYTAPTIHVFRNSTSSWKLSGSGYQIPSEPRLFKGQYAEIIAFDQSLSGDDITKLEGYLAHKWGLTGNLPVGHPYKSDAP